MYHGFRTGFEGVWCCCYYSRVFWWRLFMNRVTQKEIGYALEVFSTKSWVTNCPASHRTHWSKFSRALLAHCILLNLALIRTDTNWYIKGDKTIFRSFGTWSRLPVRLFLRLLRRGLCPLHYYSLNYDFYGRWLITVAPIVLPCSAIINPPALTN